MFKRNTASGIKKIVYATDFGNPSENVKIILRDCDVIFIESDHDDKMLYENNEIPEWRKENHIKKYHISNLQCCNILEEVLKTSKTIPQKILLLHITDKINTKDKALSMCKSMLNRNGFNSVEITT